jgi:hypothetical protein
MFVPTDTRHQMTYAGLRGGGAIETSGEPSPAGQSGLGEVPSVVLGALVPSEAEIPHQ